MNYNKIYDISIVLDDKTINYPDDSKFYLNWRRKIINNDQVNVSELKISNHNGTHIDSPFHFIEKGKKIEDYLPDDFILNAVVAKIKNKNLITYNEIKNTEIEKGNAVLIKTCNSDYLSNAKKGFNKNHVYLSEEACDFLISKKIKLLGIDYLSVDKFGDEEYPAHYKLLSCKILILESINLRNVPEGK